MAEALTPDKFWVLLTFTRYTVVSLHDGAAQAYPQDIATYAIAPGTGYPLPIVGDRVRLTVAPGAEPQLFEVVAVTHTPPVEPADQGLTYEAVVRLVAPDEELAHVIAWGGRPA